MSRGIPLDEQETVIVVQPKQVNPYADLYTCVPPMYGKIKKLAEARPDLVKITMDNGWSLMANVDPSCIKISPKRRVSDEQRAAASERMTRMRGGTK